MEVYPNEPAGVAAPPPLVGFPVPGAPSHWSSGLFDCLDDCDICKHV